MVSNTTCFTCLDSKKMNLIDIYIMDTDNISYMQKLATCLSDLYKVENMKMCKPCIKQLKMTYDFIQTVKKSQEHLKEHINDNRAIISQDISDRLNIKGDNDKSDITQELYECDSSYYILDTTINGDETYVECAKCGLYTDDSTDHKCETNEELIIKYEGVSEESDFKTDKLDKVTKRVRNKARKSDNSEVYECQYCAQVFLKRWQLTKHAGVHFQVKKHVCTYCNTAFKEAYHLREHISKHTGERNYTCTICDKTFVRKSSQSRHMKTHNAPPGQKSKRTPFLCTICGKKFPFSNGHQRHMHVHFGIKKHECQICKRKFTQSTHLIVHMRTHTGEKPYICDICGEAFSFSGGLQKHINNVHEAPDRLENLDEMPQPEG